VAIWKPSEIFRYAWPSIAARRSLFRRLSDATVTIDTKSSLKRPQRFPSLRSLRRRAKGQINDADRRPVAGICVALSTYTDGGKMIVT